MIAYVRGEFLPEEQATVPLLDRGYLYGDGLFETILVHQGRPFRWAQHLERLRKGADFLGIVPPLTPREVRGVMNELIKQNGVERAVLRVALSRGVGRRGYSPVGAVKPTLAISVHPAPEIDPASPPQWRMCTSTLVRVPANDRLSVFKTSSKLSHVVARAEADAAGVDEALLVNTNNEVTEATGGNIFWLWRDVIHTNPTAVGALPGITRAVVLELCTALGLRTQKKIVRVDMLKHAEAVFLTQSTHGIVPVLSLDEVEFAIPPALGTLSRAYWDLVAKESA